MRSKGRLFVGMLLVHNICFGMVATIEPLDVPQAPAETNHHHDACHACDIILNGKKNGYSQIRIGGTADDAVMVFANKRTTRLTGNPGEVYEHYEFIARDHNQHSQDGSNTDRVKKWAEINKQALEQSVQGKLSKAWLSIACHLHLQCTVQRVIPLDSPRSPESNATSVDSPRSTRAYASPASPRGGRLIRSSSRKIVHLGDSKSNDIQ